MGRNILFNRENVIACDVCDALTNLIGSAALPVAFSLEQITEELVRISCINDDGVMVPHSRSARTLTYESFYKTLSDAATFKNGYKQFEKKSGYQVAPVSDYLLSVLFDGTAASLDNMTEKEAKQSLPHKTDPTAGIVVYPADYKVADNGPPPLLLAHGKRGADATGGQVEAWVGRVGNMDHNKAALVRAAAAPLLQLLEVQSN